jgi:hypothetical protein
MSFITLPEAARTRLRSANHGGKTVFHFLIGNCVRPDIFRIGDAGTRIVQ